MARINIDYDNEGFNVNGNYIKYLLYKLWCPTAKVSYHKFEVINK